MCGLLRMSDRVAHLFRGGGLESAVDWRPPRLKPWGTGFVALCVGVSALAAGVSLAQQDDAVDDRAKDLAERLLGGQSDDGDLMDRALRRMSSAEERLVRRYDAGSETQALQNSIIDDLDLAIKNAARRGSSKNRAAGQGEMRRKSDRPTGEGERPRGAAVDAGGAETTGSTSEAKTDPPSGPLRETRRGWGHLPARDREEMIQGSREQSLDAYREWIERYYRALAEEGDE